jgi:hypothetical protein
MNRTSERAHPRAVSLAALALGALAIGALAIGTLAIGHLYVRKMRLRTVEIDNLTVRRLRVVDGGAPSVGSTAKRRVKSPKLRLLNQTEIEP